MLDCFWGVLQNLRLKSIYAADPASMDLVHSIAFCALVINTSVLFFSPVFSNDYIYLEHWNSAMIKGTINMKFWLQGSNRSQLCLSCEDPWARSSESLWFFKFKSPRPLIEDARLRMTNITHKKREGKYEKIFKKARPFFTLSTISVAIDRPSSW